MQGARHWNTWAVLDFTQWHLYPQSVCVHLFTWTTLGKSTLYSTPISHKNQLKNVAHFHN